MTSDLKLKVFIILGFLWSLVLLSALACKISKAEGKKEVFAFFSFLLAGGAFLSTIALVSFLITPNDAIGQEEEFLTALWVGPILLLLWGSYSLFKGMFPRTIPLEELKLPLEEINHGCQSSAQLRVAHLSDLHLTAGHTIEGNLEKEAVQQAFREALWWALRRSDLVLLTGDLTDQGKAEEWGIFLEVIAGIPEIERKKLLLVPGNHDLTLTFGWNAFSGWDSQSSRLDLDFEEKCKTFTLRILQGHEQTWSMFTDTGLTPVRAHLNGVQDFLDTYEKHPPKRSQVFIGNQPVPSVDFPIELLKASEAYPHWPTHDKFLFNELISSIIYPMLLYEDDKHIVIGLNSCCSPADTILAGGFGFLGEQQIRRLSKLLSNRASKLPILLLHHHLGIPKMMRKRLIKSFSYAQIKALQLKDATQFDQVLVSLPSVVVFHGHMHMGYHARRHNATIICGPSIAYGNVLSTESANCFVYGIDEFGSLSILDKTKIIPL